MSKLVTDVKAYSQLLLSISRHGSGQSRPLKPIECAQYIRRLIDEEKEPLHKIAERLDLGKQKDKSNIYKKRDTTQITTFLNLLKVSKKSIEFAGWGYEGYPSIPFSAISQLSTFTADEQDMIIQSIYSARDKKKIIGKEDIKKIKKWRNENPDLPITECIKKLLKLKPVAVTTYIVVSEIREKLRQFIKSNDGYKEKILEILRNDLDGKFYNIDSTAILITISMDETAYQAFHDMQYKRGISFTKFLNSFLEDKIG